MSARRHIAFSPGAAGPLLAEPEPDLSWQDRALCAEADPELFFPGNGHADHAEDAKQVCRACPVKAECLDYALATGQEYGVWGGTSEQERRRMKRQPALGEAA